MKTPLNYLVVVIRPLFKKFILSALLVGSTFFSFSQDTTAAHHLENLTKLDLSLQGIGVTFERKLGDKITIDLSAGLGGGYDIFFNDFEYKWDFINPAAYFFITPKFFYNRERIAAKGKSMAFNAGNYVGLRIKYTTRNIFEVGNVWDALLFNAHWGWQRHIGKRWSTNGHVGVGYAMDATDLQNTSGTIYPAFDFKFSYNFRKTRR